MRSELEAWVKYVLVVGRALLRRCIGWGNWMQFLKRARDGYRVDCGGLHEQWGMYRTTAGTTQRDVRALGNVEITTTGTTFKDCYALREWVALKNG